MKKIIVGLIVAGYAFGVQAAAFNWTVDCYEMATQPAGYTLYMVSGGDAASDYATALSGKSYADAAAFTAAIGSATGTLDGDAYAEGMISGVSASDTYSALLIASTAEGSQIYYASDLSLAGMTYEPGNPAPGALEVWDTDFTSGGTIAYAGATPPTPSIPEPTSGLLMLVGLGALALRRRRA